MSKHLPMPSTGDYKAHAVGSKIYLWHGESRKDTVVISSHGGFTHQNKPFKVPAYMTVQFMAPHGYILKDPGLQTAAVGAVPSFDNYTASKQCPDYELTKYQGRHGGEKETYEFIGRDMHRGARIRQFEAINKSIGAPQMTELEKEQIKNVVADIITVRNRKFMKAPTLSEIIATLEKNKIRYKNVVCAFCRCRSDLADSFDRSWNAKQGMDVTG